MMHADGLGHLFATSHVNDGPLPTLVWAYPEEFKNADFAGQVRDSPYRFDRVWCAARHASRRLRGRCVLERSQQSSVLAGKEK